MNSPFKDRWQLIYEVASNDQDRAAGFAREIVARGTEIQAVNACQEAQRLFGRAYLVNLKTGDARPVRVFDDLATIDHSRT